MLLIVSLVTEVRSISKNFNEESTAMGQVTARLIEVLVEAALVVGASFDTSRYPRRAPVDFKIEGSGLVLKSKIQLY